MTTGSRMAAAGLVTLTVLSAVASWAEAPRKGAAEDALETQALAAAPVKLGQAIVAAEQATGGTVASIEFDNGDDGEASAWDVEALLPDGTFKDVVVDATSARVTDDGVTGDDHGQAGNGESDGEEDDE